MCKRSQRVDGVPGTVGTSKGFVVCARLVKTYLLVKLNLSSSEYINISIKNHGLGQ